MASLDDLNKQIDEQQEKLNLGKFGEYIDFLQEEFWENEKAKKYFYKLFHFSNIKTIKPEDIIKKLPIYIQKQIKFLTKC